VALPVALPAAVLAAPPGDGGGVDAPSWRRVLISVTDQDADQDAIRTLRLPRS
jgi:hypothetical protein